MQNGLDLGHNKQFSVIEKEFSDSFFARFNTIITSLKALDDGFSSKNYVRKFLMAFHPNLRAKVTKIKESKDLSLLAIDELIDNLKVQEIIMKKDFEIYIGKKEKVKSVTLKAKKVSSDNESLLSDSEDEEYVMAVRDFKKFFRKKAETRIILLVIVRNLNEARTKRRLLKVLRVIARKRTMKRLIRKRVSWLNHLT
nr:UBN2 domain-containing protein [Tanacetum cinerariifolium]